MTNLNDEVRRLAENAHLRARPESIPEAVWLTLDQTDYEHIIREAMVVAMVRQGDRAHNLRKLNINGHPEYQNGWAECL